MSANPSPAFVERRARPREEPREILGVSVAPLAWDEALAAFARLVREGRFTPVGFLNAHNANVATTHPTLAGILEDFLILPDGVGVDVASKMLHGKPFPANLNGTDFVPALLRFIETPVRVGLLGAKPENANAAARALKHIAPQHDYVVVHHGFFSEGEEPAILDRLASVRPDILLVAMGVPRQELWIARHIRPEHCTMPIAVGALLDFLSGAVPRAPNLVRRLRLEWAFRLFHEPGRLWRRYILGNPVFLFRVARQWTGWRRRPPAR